MANLRPFFFGIEDDLQILGRFLGYINLLDLRFIARNVILDRLISVEILSRAKKNTRQ